MGKLLVEKSIGELAPLIKSKTISPVEVVELMVEQIKKNNNRLNAYIDVYEEQARWDALEAEREIMDGSYRGPLHGIPMGLKDNLYIKNRRTTIGSKIHQDFKPKNDATVVKKLNKSGTIFTGKLNLDEYAYGITTENPYYGTSRNPWDTKKITGGSSGGSVSAVSSHMSFASIGSETGGSLRAPSSFCGLVSIKPTYGRVSKYGCYPLAPSLDHVGPITKTVYDAALLLYKIAGYDMNDPKTSKHLVDDYTTQITGNVNDVVVGVNEDYFLHNIDPEVKSGVVKTIHKLEELGAKIEVVKIKMVHDSLYAHTVTIAAEASTVHHDHLMQRAQDFGDAIQSSLYHGETISAVKYLQAQNLREQIKQEFLHIFKKVDVLISPTVPFVAPSIGQSNVTLNNKVVPLTEHVSRLIRPATLTGIPAATVPSGLSQGMPFGVQILSAPFKEGTILNVAQAIEDMNLLDG